VGWIKGSEILIEVLIGGVDQGVRDLDHCAGRRADQDL
jgi:hypothetical protein